MAIPRLIEVAAVMPHRSLPLSFADVQRDGDERGHQFVPSLLFDPYAQVNEGVLCYDLNSVMMCLHVHTCDDALV